MPRERDERAILRGKLQRELGGYDLRLDSMSLGRTRGGLVYEVMVVKLGEYFTVRVPLGPARAYGPTAFFAVMAAVLMDERIRDEAW